jgi:hypothetical protein
VIQELHQIPLEITDESPSSPRYTFKSRLGHLRRCCRLGFKYSLLHQKLRNNLHNQSWPRCYHQEDELPPSLAKRHYLPSSWCENDPNDEGGLRLLVHNEPLKMLFPHKDIWLRYPYGRRRLCNSIQEEDVYNDASWSSWLDLVQLLPTAGIPDAFYHIKQAFLKEEATDLLSPDSYVSKGYGLSSATQAIWLGRSEDQVAEAFRVEPKLRSMTLMQRGKWTRSYLQMRVMDNGTGFGLNYAPKKEQPKPTYYWIEKKESAACFWVAACKAFYGTSMQ